MSIKIFVYGPSGQGKSASYVRLPVERTGIINPDRKGHSIEGFFNRFPLVIDRTKNPPVPDLMKSNYVATVKPESVLKTLEAWEKRGNIEFIVIDTITHVMAAEFMRRIMDKTFEKFNELGNRINNILEAVRNSNKTIIVYAHSDVGYDADGNKFNKIRSFGKLVDEKLEIPSMFNTVLRTTVKRESNMPPKYLFITQSDGADYCKSPVRLDENGNLVPILDFEEPNDITKIISKIRQAGTTPESNVQVAEFKFMETKQ